MCTQSGGRNAQFLSRTLGCTIESGFEAGTSALNKWIDVEDLVADMV